MMPDLSDKIRKLGYQLDDSSHIDAIHAEVFRFHHEPTGARFIHIADKDSENTFAVAFKTVPRDSTGVAHILEHTALCGSRRYPVKDPFFSMLKRSLSTFMNAFTASDWTMYPFSTRNRKDYYNLLSVYLDAAFFPNLSRLSFKQEGHRLELEKNGKNHKRLVFKGVVFNEMKGAMSAPDQIMGRSLLHALYPDTTYHHNSGGDPVRIPDLTHEQLVEFHRKHYHPSNAFFYSYGNFPLEDNLIYIHEKVLSRFNRIDPKTVVSNQPRWNAPRSATYYFPINPGEDPARKYQFCIAWLTADIKETFEILVLIVLERVLLGNSASPLRKALIESGLGSSLSDGAGFDADNRDTFFACGLKDVDETDRGKIRSIIFTVISDLAENGINPEWVESAIHQIEFHRREVTNTPYPYGIKLLLAISGSWFHSGDPVKVLRIDREIEKLREKIKQKYFLENKLREYFIDNPHQVAFTLAPDSEMPKKFMEKEREALDNIHAALTQTDLDKIKQDADMLEQLQEQSEDVSSLPTLKLEDIPTRVTRYSPDFVPPDAPAVGYIQPTSKIVYFSAAARPAVIPEDLAPLMPFFCHALTKSGTRDHSYEEIARRIDLYTGGIGVFASARTPFGRDETLFPLISIGGKCLERNQENMFGIIEELITRFDFGNLTRIRNLLLEYRAGLESAVVQNGHRLALSLASRRFSPALALSETWSGVHQLKYIKALTRDISDNALSGLSALLSRIGSDLFGDRRFETAVVGDETAFEIAFDKISRMMDTSNDKKKTRNTTDVPMDTGNKFPHEAWRTTTAVSFVARTFKTVRLGHPDAPALAVISKLLRSLLLHREIREKGGAYGGFAMYNPESGIFGYASYRDPHISRTLDVYDGASTFIKSGDYSREDITEAVLQLCSEIDKPDPPGPGAKKAFFRRLTNVSDETRLAFKQQILAMNREKILEAANRYFNNDPDQYAVAVISGEEQIKAFDGTRKKTPLTIQRI